MSNKAVEIIASIEPDVLGRRLRLARLKANASIKAIETSLSMKGLLKMEKGELMPTPEQLIELAIEYRISLASIIQGEKHEKIKWYGDFQDETI